MNNDNFQNEDNDRDKSLRDDLGADTNHDQLKYDADSNSFELDVPSDDPDYDHPDPYITAPQVGDDFDSSYDEANPYAVDEYIPGESLETDAGNLGMHVGDEDDILGVDPLDEDLAHTPEDDRDDLDEEGYPKNDTPPENTLPIV